MIKTHTLYRPVGVKELGLIREAGWKCLPPRFDWQPIFYPVLNEEYAEQIARDWNTKDAGSGYAGFVTAFEVDAEYLTQFKEHLVGSSLHRQLWIPSDELPNFNAHIVGSIRVLKAFYGDQYTGSKEF